MNTGKELLYLAENDVKKIEIEMDVLMDTLEEVHRARKAGAVQMPPKPGLRPQVPGFLDGYTAYVPGTNYMGIKWLSGYFDNPAKGLPFITGLMILNEPETGVPVCVMGCGQLTALRTGAMNGMGLRYLAKQDVKKLCVIGCGLQGRTNLRAAMAARGTEVSEIACWDVLPSSAQRYAEEAANWFPQVRVHACDEAEEAVTDADVLVIGAPLLKGDGGRVIQKEWLKPGVTAMAVNGDASFARDAAALFDAVYTDDRESYPERKASGMLAGELTDHCAELGELLVGAAEGRTSEEQRILIAPEGMAINDVSCGRKLFEAALAQGIGTILPIF